MHFEGQGFSVEGVLVEMNARHYVLANAAHVEAADRSVPLDGRTWVPRERVLYLQELG